MSDHESESTDQSEKELFQELLQAERLQEITQTTTLQGQIVALVLILRDQGVINKAQVDKWEKASEKIGDLLLRMTKANEIRSLDSNEDPEGQLEILLDGAEATLEFTRLMGNSDEALAPLIEGCNDLRSALEELRSEP